MTKLSNKFFESTVCIPKIYYDWYTCTNCYGCNTHYLLWLIYLLFTMVDMPTAYYGWYNYTIYHG